MGSGTFCRRFSECIATSGGCGYSDYVITPALQLAGQDLPWLPNWRPGSVFSFSPYSTRIIVIFCKRLCSKSIATNI